jgi:hypothetical protein
MTSQDGDDDLYEGFNYEIDVPPAGAGFQPQFGQQPVFGQAKYVQKTVHNRSDQKQPEPYL